MRKNIFVIAPGRSGSTLVIHLLNSQLPKPSISQEIHGRTILQHITWIAGKSSRPSRSIQLCITDLKKPIDHKITDRHPFYKYQYWPTTAKLDNNSPKEKVMLTLEQEIFNCDQDIVGCKVLVDDQNINMISSEILTLLDMSPNSYVIINTRNPQDILASQKHAGGFGKFNSKYAVQLLKKIKHPRVYQTTFETLRTDIPRIIVELGLRFDQGLFDIAIQQQCSYNPLHKNQPL